MNGATVRRLRGERGWSQQRLADLAGIQRHTLSEIELGRTVRPNAGTKFKLARALRVYTSTLE